MIKNKISEKLWNVIKDNYDTKNYTTAINNSLIYFNEVVREKSGSKLDGTELMQNVFSAKNPKIKITECETKTDKNIQDGYRELSTGLIRMIRNPRAHNRIEDKQEDADKIILFVDYLLSMIIDFTKPDIAEDWVDFILDENFNTYESNAEIVLRNIPENKRYDVFIGIIRRYKEIKEHKDLRFIVSKLYSSLNEDNKSEFCKYSSELFLKIKVDENIKGLFFIVPKELWNSINPLSRGRISGILLDALEKAEMEFDYSGAILNYEAELCLSVKDSFFDIVDIEDYKIFLERIFTSDENEWMLLGFLKKYFDFSFENINSLFFKEIYSKNSLSINNDDLKYIFKKYGDIEFEENDTSCSDFQIETPF